MKVTRSWTIQFFFLSQIGDRVYTLYAEGSYAQYALAKAVDVDHLSDKLTYEQGAALGIPYLTVHRALFTKYVM